MWAAVGQEDFLEKGPELALEEGEVLLALPPAGALLTSSQGDSSVLKLKAKLNQEQTHTQHRGHLSGGNGGRVY